MSEWLLKELEFDGTLVSIGGLGVSEVWQPLMLQKGIDSFYQVLRYLACQYHGLLNHGFSKHVIDCICEPSNDVSSCIDSHSAGI